MTWALPFYQAKPGAYIHRIRSGVHHTFDGAYSHTSVRLWCSGMGFLGSTRPQAKLFADGPENGVFCATCEGRAIGAGLTESRVICGRMLVYSPRL